MPLQKQKDELDQEFQEAPMEMEGERMKEMHKGMHEGMSKKTSEEASNQISIPLTPELKKLSVGDVLTVRQIRENEVIFDVGKKWVR